MNHYAQRMPGNLEIDAELKQPIRVKENEDYEYAKRFIQIESIPKNIRFGVFKLPFKYSSNGKVNGIPKAQDNVCALPHFWYFIEKIHSGKILQ